MKKIAGIFLNPERIKINVLLIMMSLFCLSLSVFRYYLTDTKMFLFLNWNLFLAFVPWMISSYLIFKKTGSRIRLTILVFSWLLFFPNAPYILTDLMHLRLKTEAPIWYELIVILSFAWTGLMYGFISLMDINTLLKKFTSERIANAVIVLFLFISSFGIYLGRYLRWNSWDIISDPFGLFQDVAHRFLHPANYPAAWALTFLMGLLLNMMYFSIKLITEKQKSY